MKIAWWMLNNSDPSQFTMNSPKHTNPVVEACLDRGHDVIFNHIIKGAAGAGSKNAEDNGPLKNNWMCNWSDEPRQIHETIQEMVKETSGYDPQNRAQRKLRAWMDSLEWPTLQGFDVQYIELSPCVSLLPKLELAHAIMRGVLSGVHTVLVDRDYNANVVLSTVDDLFKIGGEKDGWSREEFKRYFHLWSPYVRRIYGGDQIVEIPCYNPSAELPLDKDAELDYTFAYVGNDYHREEYLQKFYKREHDDGRVVHSAIYGRWKLDRYPELVRAVGADAFKGPVAPQDISKSYRTAAASIGITHRGFYGPKLIAFRWFEVPEAGRLFFIDSKLRNSLGLYPEERFVEAPEQARTAVEHAIGLNYYWDLIEMDRDWLRADHRLAPNWTAKALECLAMGLHKDFPWTYPDVNDVNPRVI